MPYGNETVWSTKDFPVCVSSSSRAYRCIVRPSCIASSLDSSPACSESGDGLLREGSSHRNLRGLGMEGCVCRRHLKEPLKWYGLVVSLGSPFECSLRKLRPLHPDTALHLQPQLRLTQENTYCSWSETLLSFLHGYKKLYTPLMRYNTFTTGLFWGPNTWCAISIWCFFNLIFSV